MLCPEVWNFPVPKILISEQNNVDTEAVKKIINMNNFYESVVVTLPDEISLPNLIKELTLDSEYYELRQCPIGIFLEADFIDNFVKKGSLTCLSFGGPCIVSNCVAITPDGTLTVHVIDYIYQQLGLEGKKQPYNFYEIQVNLKDKIHPRTKLGLSKLESFDFYLSWKPEDDTVCPSSIAKYLFDQNMKILQCEVKLKQITPDIEEIPCIEEAQCGEVIEWIGMLVHGGDLTPEHEYVSSYTKPQSENALKCSRLLLVHAEGFFGASTVLALCGLVRDRVGERELERLWGSVSAQTCPHSPWRSGPSRTHFHTHDSSTTIFFSKHNNKVYSIGQSKFV